MRPRKALPYLFLTAVMTVIAVLINAASVGQIKGIITDAETGDPVAGASILVMGTKFGAMTDHEGRYTIDRLEPGTYRLKISHLDYNPVIVTDVLVKADLTTKVSQELTRKVTETGETIEVVADVEIIDKFKTSNETRVNRSRVEKKPVSTVDELLSTVLGSKEQQAAEARIRGSRDGEVAYRVDRRPVGDPVGGLNRPEAKHRPQPKTGPWGPVHGGTTNPNGEPFSAMFFDHYGVNPFVDTEDDHLSTFAIDVDDASYIMTRSYLERGHLPPDEAVRVEEFVNHFEYNYGYPEHKAFGLHFEGAPSPFGSNCYLLKVGIQGRDVRRRDRKPANLVFVIDVSGSMGCENRLGMVKRGLRMMVDNLRASDRVGIVVYGSRGRVVLESTALHHRGRIEVMAAIDGLIHGGSTCAEEGIKLGYAMADRHFDRRRINRIVLCSDGVANVGQTGPEAILKDIKHYADKGITMTTVGFGMGNYNDILMEKLGNKGNGQYAYVDDVDEARRFFVDELTGVLQTIAGDVKIQIEWDPAMVRSYRLLGYENREVDDDKFRDDKEDGGEIGAGHQVTALYEIKLNRPATRRRGPLGTMFVRYKDPDLREVIEVKRAIGQESLKSYASMCSNDFRLAAATAELAEILRDSYWARGSTVDDVIAFLGGYYNEFEDERFAELTEMIRLVSQHREELAQR